jgi:Domain of unknown function (DUF1844)
MQCTLLDIPTFRVYNPDMPEEEEEGFTFRDRRRFQVEETSAPAPEPAPAMVVETEVETEVEELYDEEEMGEPGEIPDVRSVLALFLGELRNLAWLRMGLVANPVTHQIEKDLMQAKMAIDTVAFLASQLEPHVAPEERLPLKAMVSDLQVNFVEQSKHP